MSVSTPRTRLHRSVALGVAGCLLPVLAAAGQAVPPPLSDAEKEAFLLQARIVSRHDLPVGVTRSQRATLSDGRLTHDAHIQTIDKSHPKLRTPQRVHINLRDSYRYNIAAYRLDRLLGLNMVPVSVERRVAGKRAAVTWWVDDVLMMAADRLSRDVEPPDPVSWNDQKHQARVFNQLISNTDPNLGNFLITTDWRLWMIDFTRAFRTYHQLLEPTKIQRIERIDRRFYRGLQALDRKTLQRTVKRHLTGPEMNALISRRGKILEILEARIARQGEGAVICDQPGH